MFKQLIDAWTNFLTSLDSAGGHIFLFAGLYIGMSFCHCPNEEKNAVLQALLLVLRPGGK